MLGFPHWDYLEPWLSAAQLEDWLCWLRHFQPFATRDDWAWGLLLAMTHNQWCERDEALPPVDFMPYHDRFLAELTADELRRKLGLRG